MQLCLTETEFGRPPRGPGRGIKTCFSQLQHINTSHKCNQPAQATSHEARQGARPLGLQMAPGPSLWRCLFHLVALPIPLGAVFYI